MANPIPRLEPVRLPEGPRPVTAEQLYWKSFKNQLLIPSPSSFPVTHISYPSAAASPLSTAAAANDTFAVTTGTRVQLYSVRTRKLVKTITRFQDIARSGDVRKDGRILVAGEDSGRIQVFHLESRSILKTWAVHKQPTWSTKFSPASLTSVVSASDDKTVRLWDLTVNDPVKTFVGHGDYVRSASFMPGSMSNILVSGSYDSTVKLWDPRTPGNSAIMTFKHADPVEDVLPLSAGTTVLASASNSISVLDIVAARPLHLMSNHQKTVTSLCEASGGRRVVSGGLDGHVKVYETTGWNVVSTSKYHSPVLSVKVVGSGSGEDAVDRHLVVGMQSGVLSIRTRLTGAESAKEKEREKEMNALLAGKLDQHDAVVNQKKAKISWKKKMTAMGKTADAVIEDAGAIMNPKEVPWQKKLRKGQYAAALDEVLNPKSPHHGPANTLTLLLALSHRNALRDALKDRDEDSVQPILRWTANHLLDTRYAVVCVEVGMHLLDLYSEFIEHSDRLREDFRTLHRRVRVEVERAQLAFQTMGALESLMIGAA